VIVARGGVVIDESDDGCDPPGGGGDPLHRVFVGLHEPVVFHQVADAVAGQRHFRRHDEVGSAGPRLADGVQNLRGVGLDIAADRIQLCERDTHPCRSYSDKRTSGSE
jgi:hypothetical protein